MFGRGQRTELDEEEAAQLAVDIRERLRQEVINVRENEGIDLCQDWGGNAQLGARADSTHGREGRGKL